jgi:hypothetical protein
MVVDDLREMGRKGLVDRQARFSSGHKWPGFLAASTLIVIVGRG